MDLYIYRVRPLSIYDGDTISDAIIDFGFEHRIRVRWKAPIHGIRLYGIDTPELRGGSPLETARAIEARETLISLAEPGQWTLCRTHLDRSGKLGRILTEIWPTGATTDTPTINKRLIQAGLAVPYHGRAGEERWRDVHAS